MKQLYQVHITKHSKASQAHKESKNMEEDLRDIQVMTVTRPAWEHRVWRDKILFLQGQ